MGIDLKVPHSPLEKIAFFYKDHKFPIFLAVTIIGIFTYVQLYYLKGLNDARSRAEVEIVLPGMYVAPNGTAQGAGTIASPWDLQTALHGASGRVKPGDTIWLRGGTYGNGGNTIFTSDMQGTEATPIVVRQYPGERATVDGGIVASGSWTWYWGFEIMNSSAQRTGDSTTNFRPPGIYMAGPPGNGRGNKVINMIIHDTGHPGIGFWSGVGDGGEIYGSLIWGVGIYDSKTTFNGGARGSPIYAQNKDGNRYIRDNITFRNFTTGMKAYTEGGYANGFVFDGNAVFDAGGGSNEWLLFVAAKTYPTNNVTITNNYTYRRPNDNERGVQIGYYSTLQGTATIQNNYLVTRGYSNGAFYGYNWTNFNSSGNTFISTNKVFNINSTYSQSAYVSDNNKFYSSYATPFRKNSTEYSFTNWKSQTGLDLNSTFESSLPTENKIFVRPNKYETGRANIIVYNWQKSNSVSVDISSAGLSSGMSYKVMDAQNFYGDPVAQGVYNGNSISLPMNLTKVASLIGGVTHINNIHTAPDFAAFVLLPVGVNPTAEPTPASTVTPTSPPTIVTQPANPTPTPTPTSISGTILTFTTPLEGQTVSGSVPVAVDAFAPAGVTRVEFAYMSGTWNGIASDYVAPYSHSWSTSGLSSGSRKLRARLLDKLGNYTIRYVTVYVGNSITPTPTPTKIPTPTPTVSKSYGITVMAIDTRKYRILSCSISANISSFSGTTSYTRTSSVPFSVALTAPSKCQGRNFASWSTGATSRSTTASDLTANDGETVYIIYYK